MKHLSQLPMGPLVIAVIAVVSSVAVAVWPTQEQDGDQDRVELHDRMVRLVRKELGIQPRIIARQRYRVS